MFCRAHLLISYVLVSFDNCLLIVVTSNMLFQTVTLQQLSQQFSALATAVTEQQKIMTEQQKIIKHVVLQIPVQIRSFNSAHQFFAPMYRNLADLFLHTFKEFRLDPSSFVDQRFYWLPPGDLATAERIEKRVTVRTESEWQTLLDSCYNQNISLITLFFVSGDQSPSLFERPAPPSPPRLPSSEQEDKKSEAESVHGLAERDGGRCFICGESTPVAAHVIDKHRSELLIGAPDAPDVDDLRNHFQLCPNHHSSFDRFEWTLVEVKLHSESSDAINKFYLRPCPLYPQPTPSLAAHMQTVYQFSSPDRSPPAFLFLLKQLGRFKVPCRVCGSLWLPVSISGHYGGAHNSAADRVLWKDLPHLLPRACDCHDAGSSIWELYCHIIAKHSELIYV